MVMYLSTSCLGMLSVHVMMMMMMMMMMWFWLSVTSCDMFPRGHDKHAPLLGVKSPKSQYRLGAKGVFKPKSQIWKHAYYRNYCIDSNQILHKDKVQQTPVLGGSNTRITNSRCQPAAMLENRKSPYQKQWFDQSPGNFARSRNLSSWSFPPLKSPRWPRPPFRKIENSLYFSNIFTDCHEMLRGNAVWSSWPFAPL